MMAVELLEKYAVKNQGQLDFSYNETNKTWTGCFIPDEGKSVDTIVGERRSQKGQATLEAASKELCVKLGIEL